MRSSPIALPDLAARRASSTSRTDVMKSIEIESADVSANCLSCRLMDDAINCNGSVVKAASMCEKCLNHLSALSWKDSIGTPSSSNRVADGAQKERDLEEVPPRRGLTAFHTSSLVLAAALMATSRKCARLSRMMAFLMMAAVFWV